ncbi:hypothetical protein [Nostoc sp. 'Lobaria pulmonaria (5183) cyanobiont']|uniref:hypothetical protein n=1 Tax=Nostoc sp. 'Lobaria pulmonaria (5183) cyanobiont' TaxID=1618022 RepID=UPI000CF3029F|nr:hypothetical protein [Nostoc sp. 'Lobaria pulmonaria (5183) cyanobiont']
MRVFASQYLSPEEIHLNSVQRIHQPQSEKLEREELPDEEDELQMKPQGSIQGEELPEVNKINSFFTQFVQSIHQKISG